MVTCPGSIDAGSQVVVHPFVYAPLGTLLHQRTLPMIKVEVPPACIMYYSANDAARLSPPSQEGWVFVSAGYWKGCSSAESRATADMESSKIIQLDTLSIFSYFPFFFA